MKNDRYTCTSNTVKLYKHLDTLKLLQEGQVVPILIHMSPTNKCNLNCVHCCFKNREKNLDMPFDVAKSGIEQFYRLGTRALELTGGGDPTLYPQINELIAFLHDMGFHLGINTNAISSGLVKEWDRFDWVRVSMNTFDYDVAIDIDPIRQSGADLTACYIWNKNSTEETLNRVAAFCIKENIVCRIAPDCIKPVDEIDADMEMLKLLHVEPPLFLSDFNVTTTRHSLDCRLHMIKPCFYTDGYVYPCPSLELAHENDCQLPLSFRICNHTEIYDFYKSEKALAATERTCSYCKYAKQQVVLDELLMETEHNAFS